MTGNQNQALKARTCATALIVVAISWKW